ncbi:hypothetical protein JCM16358_05130 [Halanaerocella petrolearia]
MKQRKATTKLLLITLFLLVLVSGCQDNHPARTANLKQQTTDYRIKESSNIAKKDKVKSKREVMTRKIIKEANLKLINNNLTTIPEEIKTIVNNYNGYIANSRQGHNNKQKFQYYTVRVPQQKFTTFIEELNKLGRLENKQIRSKDITKEYIDLQARLNNFKKQEKRYLELLQEAKQVEEILKIEKELNRTRRNIEQLQGRINYYDNQVNLSTINIQFRQPKQLINDKAWGLIDSLQQAVQGFIESINLIIILIGRLIPWTLLVGIIGFIGYKIYKSKEN